MRFRVAAAVGVAMLTSACGTWGGKTRPPAEGETVIKPDSRPAIVSRCPVPVHYDDEMLRMIQQSIDALPPDSVLRQVLKDYETERDDLRHCK